MVDCISNPLVVIEGILSEICYIVSMTGESAQIGEVLPLEAPQKRSEAAMVESITEIYFLVKKTRETRYGMTSRFSVVSLIVVSVDSEG